jgi:hypothetical protein
MLKIYGFLVSFFLIGIIFLRIPQESVGLSSFATKSNLLGSPRSAQRFFKYFNCFWNSNLCGHCYKIKPGKYINFLIDYLLLRNILLNKMFNIIKGSSIIKI